MRRAFRITGAVCGLGLAASLFARGEPVPGVVFGLMGLGLVVLAFTKFDPVRRFSRPDALENARGLRLYNALFAGVLLVCFVVVVVLAVQADDARREGFIVLAVALGLLAALVLTVVVLSEHWLRRRRRCRDSTSERGVEAERQGGPPGGGITFYREDVLANGMVSYRIEVDGQRVGVLPPVSSLVVPLSPGVHSCRARLWWGSSPPVDIEVKFGQEVRVLVAPPDNPMERPLRQLRERDSWLSLVPDHSPTPR